MGRAIYRGAAKLLAGTGISTLPGLRTLNALFVAGIRGKTVYVHGHRIRLDPVDSLSLSAMGSFAPAETRLVSTRVNPGAIVLDIGANIGYFTLLFARHAGPTGHVYAFEPEPVNYALLVRNVHENAYSNVTCIQAAASNASGSVTLHLARDNAVDHGIAPHAGAGGTIDVRAQRVDDYLSFLNHADFIKIDVRGAELHVLEGMEHLLARSPSVELLVEYWPAGLVRAGTNPQRILDWLEQKGFRFRVCADRGDAEPINAAAVSNRFPAESQRSVNLYVTR